MKIEDVKKAQRLMDRIERHKARLEKLEVMRDPDIRISDMDSNVLFGFDESETGELLIYAHQLVQDHIAALERELEEL